VESAVSERKAINNGEIAPIARAYFDKDQNVLKLLETAFANMALRTRVLPALTGSLSITFLSEGNDWHGYSAHTSCAAYCAASG
jgi:hypothetical protein